MINNFFVISSRVINRASTIDALEKFDNLGISNSCDCVNCHSCDNSCNR